MSRVTVLLNDVVDDRERRSRMIAAAGILLGLLGVAVHPLETKTVYLRGPVVTEYRTIYVYGGRPVLPVVGHRPGRPATAGGAPALPSGRDLSDVAPEVVGTQTRHLCISPRRLDFTNVDLQEIVVSNPSAGEIGITKIGVVRNRDDSAFHVDTSACRDRVLRPGERCSITIACMRHLPESMELLVSNDAGSRPESMTVEAH